MSCSPLSTCAFFTKNPVNERRRLWLWMHGLSLAITWEILVGNGAGLWRTYATISSVEIRIRAQERFKIDREMLYRFALFCLTGSSLHSNDFAIVMWEGPSFQATSPRDTNSDIPVFD